MKMNRRQILASTCAAIAVPLFAPHVARAATRKFRLGHNNSPTSAIHLGAVEIQKFIAEKSEGRLTLELFPSAQLGGDLALVKAVSEGTLDATICGTAAMASVAPDLELLELPFMIKDIASGRKAFDGPLSEFVSEKLKPSNVLYIGPGESGFRHITANKPVRKPEDLAGLKIRVQPSKVQLAVFKGLGAMPEAINFSELAEALRVGRTDAQENPIGIITANEFLQKSQTHISLTGHIYSTLNILFSADVMDELSEADRAIVRNGGKAGVAATRTISDQATAAGLDRLKAAGMTVVADVDKAAFQKAVDGLGDQLKPIVNPSALSQLQKLVA